MEIHNKIAKDLSSVLGKKFDKLSIANEQALSTIDTSAGRIFTLEYTASGKTYGNVTVNIVDPSTLVVYYNNNISEDMRYDDKKDWYGFLKELRYFAKRNLMGFDVRNIGKQQLDKKDYAYIKTNMTASNAEDIQMESKMHGSLKTSYQNIGEVRVVVKHRKPVDEEKRGARTRYIHSLYVEDNSKQRTKLPHNYLAGARALAQHVNQGGMYEDEVGQHIFEMIQEIVDLKKFVKSFRRADNFAEQEEATKIIEQARERAIGLHSTLKTLAGPKGYRGYVEQYEPTEESIEQADLDDIRSKLTRIHKDNVVDTVLPSLARGLKAMENMKVADKEADDYAEFEKEMDKKKDSSIADVIAFSKSNDDIEILDVPDQVDKLKSELDMIKVKKFDKDEEKNKQQKNRNILKSVIDYLELNVADDAMGNAIAQLDQDNAEQRAAAMRLAMKYLKGKTKKISKAKKDLYGKDKKMEDAQFEDWANNIVEGTWAIPDTQEDVDKIAELMKNPLPLGPDGQDATNAISAAIGDDELFDDLYMAGEKDPNGDARPIIKDWIMKNIQGYDGMPADLVRKLMDMMQGKEQMDLPLENKTPGDSHYNMQKAKELAKKDGKDPERLTHGELKAYIEKAEKMEAVEEAVPYDQIQKSRKEVKVSMVAPALEKLLASYKKDEKDYNDQRAEVEAELKAKGMSDKEIEDDIMNGDYDFHYLNIDDLEDKIEAIEDIMKNPNSDGEDIASMVDYGIGDTSAREEFLNDVKIAIKQDHPELYSKIFMYDVGESEDDSEYNDQLKELRSLAFGLDEDDTDYPQVVGRNMEKERVMDIMKKYPAETKKLQMSGDLMDVYDTDLYLDLFDYYSEDMPYGTMKGRDGDPVQYISDELDDLGLLEDKLSVKEDEGFDIKTVLTPQQIQAAENDDLDLDEIDQQMYNNMTKDPMQIKKDIQDEIEEFLDHALGADEVPVDDVFYDFGDYRAEVILFGDEATKKAYFGVRGIDDEDDVEEFIMACRQALADLGRVINNDELDDMQRQARKSFGLESKKEDDAFKQRMLELAGL